MAPEKWLKIEVLACTKKGSPGRYQCIDWRAGLRQFFCAFAAPSARSDGEHLNFLNPASSGGAGCHFPDANLSQMLDGISRIAQMKPIICVISVISSVICGNLRQSINQTNQST